MRGPPTAPTLHPTPPRAECARACELVTRRYQALLLLFFTLVTPFAVGAFTSSHSCAQGAADSSTCPVETGTIALSAFLSAIIVGSFNSMWLIANEMEDPFGARHVG